MTFGAVADRGARALLVALEIAQPRPVRRVESHAAGPEVHERVIAVKPPQAAPALSPP
jgi:hypothetical protein